jgi:CheY-like chemotaxis protein
MSGRDRSPGERRRVLVIEDELMIAMLIEDMLDELGYDVVVTAMRLDQAEEAARGADFDLAMLDVNIAGQWSFPVAAILHDRGIPFLFATGYGQAGVTAHYPDATVLKKPFTTQQLGQALASLGGTPA